MDRSPFVALLIILVISLGACGGGGGGGGVPALLIADNTLFVGEYHVFFLQGFDNAGTRLFRSSVGALTADGAGGITTELQENEDGVVSGPSIASLITYEVDADRLVRWFVPAISPDATWGGGITPTGDVLVLSSIRSGSDPEIIIAFRKGAGFSRALLNGAYHLGEYGNGVAGDDYGLLGTTNFNGDRDWDDAISTSNINDGMILATPFARDGNYTVTDTGVAFVVTSTLTQRGGVFGSGEMLVTGGSTTPGFDPRLTIRIRQASGLSDASFSGDYFMVGLYHDNDADSYVSRFGIFTSTGAGHGDFPYQDNENGTSGGGFVLDADYQVSADGGLDMDLVDALCAGPYCWRGALSQSGRVAMVSGGHAPGSNPGMYFFVKK